MNKIILGDSLNVLKKLEENSFSLFYIDPPFNLGHKQKRNRIDEKSSDFFYEDTFSDFEDFLISRIKLALPLLKSNGSFFIHLNQKEIHYIKVAIDKLIGRDKFMNEIIYTWDYGGKSKKKWSVKHDTILWYSLDPNNYIFNYDQIDKIPYKAPDLVLSTSKDKELAQKKILEGKVPTSVWDLGIVHTNSKENYRYPTQKPIRLLSRILKVHSNENDNILDFFAGSGTTAISSFLLNRNFTVVDKNPQAISVIKKRCDDLNAKYLYVENRL